MVQLDNAARWALVILATIATFAALYVGREVFAPLALALVIGVVMSPLSDALERLGLGRLTATLVTLGLALVLVLGLGFLLVPLAQDVLNRMPRIWAELREAADSLQSLLQGLRQASAEVAQAIDPKNGAGNADEAPLTLPRITDALMFAPSVALQLLLFIGTLFFFILSRDEVYRWLGQIFDRVEAPGRFAGRLRRAERRVSRYFVTITLINAGLGLAVAGVLSVVGLPSPLLWGFVAALLNFILYLGPAMLAAALVVAGAVSFDGPTTLLPVAVYLALHVTEGQFVTPALIGRNMALNPLLVFVSLVFWMWMWGPIGGIVAIPLLIWGVAIATPRQVRRRRQAVSLARGVPAVAAAVCPPEDEAAPPAL